MGREQVVDLIVMPRVVLELGDERHVPRPRLEHRS